MGGSAERMTPRSAAQPPSAALEPGCSGEGSTLLAEHACRALPGRTDRISGIKIFARCGTAAGFFRFLRSY